MLEDKQRIRNGIIKRLRKAVECQDIYLDYQPQFDLGNGELIGFEALARWRDAELGIVSPELFIPIAEECGLINQLGEDLLRRACRETKRWANLAAPAIDLCVSVNLSPIQLSKADIASVVGDILEQEAFPANRLELEITERILISDPELAQQQLEKLAALGVGLALDDFGKGYSSLSYLQSLSLTRLKIDQSFIANINKPKGEAFIRAIVQLAKALDLKVIAEGIETRRQCEALVSMGCCAGQGHLFSPSVAPNQMLKLALNGDAVLRDIMAEGLLVKQA
jgi:EAL domain-containing protein (putative c-di-GMP-specific phosphodiesterase class I)